MRISIERKSMGEYLCFATVDEIGRIWISVRRAGSVSGFKSPAQTCLRPVSSNFLPPHPSLPAHREPASRSAPPRAPSLRKARSRNSLRSRPSTGLPGQATLLSLKPCLFAAVYSIFRRTCDCPAVSSKLRAVRARTMPMLAAHGIRSPRMEMQPAQPNRPRSMPRVSILALA
jgi:hypothetical protein